MVEQNEVVQKKSCALWRLLSSWANNYWSCTHRGDAHVSNDGHMDHNDVSDLLDNIGEEIVLEQSQIQ